MRLSNICLARGNVQRLTASLVPDTGAPIYFNVMALESKGSAVCNGSMDLLDASVLLTEDGEWIVRV